MQAATFRATLSMLIPVLFCMPAEAGESRAAHLVDLVQLADDVEAHVRVHVLEQRQEHRHQVVDGGLRMRGGKKQGEERSVSMVPDRHWGLLTCRAWRHGMAKSVVQDVCSAAHEIQAHEQVRHEFSRVWVHSNIYRAVRDVPKVPSRLHMHQQ